MAYSKEVMEHYDNPKNVGSLDKTKENVGTGLVGAPECFGGETLIHTPVQQYISLEEAYTLKRTINVWSYSIDEDTYKFKMAKVVYSGKKYLFTYEIGDRKVRVTKDHQFLTVENGYKAIEDIKTSDFVRGVQSEINADIYDFESNHRLIMPCYDEPPIEDDCYTLQVEETNNYIIITHFDHEVYSGVVVKNCGDVMKLQIEVDDNEKIIDAKFKTFGCGSAIASSSLATEWIKGKTVDNAMEISNKDIVEEFSLPPVKIHCSVLAEEAIKAAIADYRKKKESLTL